MARTERVAANAERDAMVAEDRCTTPVTASYVRQYLAPYALFWAVGSQDPLAFWKSGHRLLLPLLLLPCLPLAERAHPLGAPPGQDRRAWVRAQGRRPALGFAAAEPAEGEHRRSVGMGRAAPAGSGTAGLPAGVA